MKLSKTKLDIALAKSGLSSYAQLARKMGCNAQSLYTTMSRKNCRPATVGKIANALEVPVEDLVEVMNK